MAYRIEYDENPKYMTETTFSWSRVRKLTAAFLAVFILLANLFWPKGRAMLQRMITPGNPETTSMAMTVMLDRLQAGEGLEEAVTAFCHEILSHAQISD